MSTVACMVLAAGKGTRMKSSRPKVLFDVLGRPMIVRLLETLLDGPRMHLVVVVGHEAEEVQEVIQRALPRRRPIFALQTEQRGTGHAVATAMTQTPRSHSTIVVVNGDLPLLTGSTISKLLSTHRRRRAGMTVATMDLSDPAGYGRIIRDGDGGILCVREQKDCSAKEKKVREVNAGLYCFSRAFLEDRIGLLGTGNAQNEFYLTDLVQMAAQDGDGRLASVSVDPEELTGVNDRAELARVQEVLLDRVRTAHMRRGVTLHMPASTWIDETVTIEPDVVIGPRCTLLGRTVIRRGSRVGTGSIIEDCRIHRDVQVKPYCILEHSEVRREAILGPWARLRPGSDVGMGAHVGNFVELKKTTMGRGAKANHLSYLGDGVIGRDVNVGAGTIFCNYDGYGKHTTVIEDDVFIGSDSQMVAPVTVGKGSYVGSGSTITRNVPANSLALARAKQVIKKGRASILREYLGGLKRTRDVNARKRRRRRGKSS